MLAASVAYHITILSHTNKSASNNNNNSMVVVTDDHKIDPDNSDMKYQLQCIWNITSLHRLSMK